MRPLVAPQPCPYVLQALARERRTLQQHHPLQRSSNARHSTSATIVAVDIEQERTARREYILRRHEPSWSARPPLDGGRAIRDDLLQRWPRPHCGSLKNSAANEHKVLEQVKLARDAAHHQHVCSAIVARATRHSSLWRPPQTAGGARHGSKHSS